MNSEDIIEREKKVIQDICNLYGYDNNISHLLYLMIPAFIIKYGISNEKLILDVFRNIQIIHSNKKSSYVRAFYSSSLFFHNGKYLSKKVMVIQNYDKIHLVELLDNLIHEFNHAINSYVNEIIVRDKYIYLRTGLTFRIYNKSNLSFIKKQDSYILEEIINTKQTSDIINIIKKFKSNDFSIQNTIYAINNETNNKYYSDAYSLQTYVCRDLLNNRTFLSTLEKLRLTGDVLEIKKWFDNIVGRKGAFQELIQYLKEILDLEMKYSNQKIMKGITANKIRNVTDKIKDIVEQFTSSVH